MSAHSAALKLVAIASVNGKAHVSCRGLLAISGALEHQDNVGAHAGCARSQCVQLLSKMTSCDSRFWV
eukprot:5281600-Amphidinium_carterae.1